jgi:hypothetical protein
MYLRVVQFSLGPGKRSAAEGVANKVIPPIRKQPGCLRAEFYLDEAKGDYGFIVLWASKQTADASYPIIYPILTSAVDAAGANGTLKIYTHEVYEPQQAMA